LIVQHFSAQEESHEAMKTLANSMSILAGQLRRLEQAPKSDQLGATISEFPKMMGEVVDFIQTWLDSWTCTYQFI